MAAGDKGAAETFDPGVETGYLRRARRDRELPLEEGAAPFDPGPGVGYDTKRARRWAKDREHDTSGPAAREESAELVGLLVERDEQTAEERELEDERKRALRDREAELRRERLARDRAEREARRDREREELESVVRLKEEERERERLERLDREERQREERRREELERRAELQEERELALREERERRQTDRARRQQEWQRRREAVEGKRRRRAERKAAKVAAARRRRAKTQLALSRGHSGETGEKTRPSAATARPEERRAKAGARRRPSAPIRKRELAAPTAKAGVALATAATAATFIASALGLPVPGLGSDENLVASLTGAAAPDSGSPIALTAGPYFPVVLDGPADYAEAAARFGANRGGRKHEGQDIFAKPGTQLVAVRDGIVIDGGGGKSFYSYGGGNSLVIYSPLDDRSYVYLHMLKPATVQAGDAVNAGQPVGQLGCTGSCDGPHLHFEVRRGRVGYGVDTKPLDPMPLLQQWPQVGRE